MSCINIVTLPLRGASLRALADRALPAFLTGKCAGFDCRIVMLMLVQGSATVALAHWYSLSTEVSLRRSHKALLLAGCSIFISAIAASCARRRAMSHPSRQQELLSRDESQDRTQMLASKLERAFGLPDELSLAFQPIYGSAGELVAAESLSRWNEPSEGPISPAEFIPVAESTGLIIPLNEWVLRRSCAQMRSWLDNGIVIGHIAVNVSVLQVWRSDFVSSVRAILAETGLEPHRLELEVTESALCRDFEAVKQNLQELRRTGVRISIDDFGTGYSSLGRLRELDADVLKIDRSFVSGAMESTNGVTLVQSIIGMAHSLGLKVVAEGVETQEQHELLSAMKCDAFQGFLFSRPLPPEGFRTLFTSMREAIASPSLSAA